MNDRELLEAAARAAGRLRPHGNAYLTRPNEELHHDGDTYWFWPAGDSWNPLEDDGDVLRLAVKTGRTDLSQLVGKLMVIGECKGLTGIALVRRAVVWDVAASEIGSPQTPQERIEMTDEQLLSADAAIDAQKGTV